MMIPASGNIISSVPQIQASNNGTISKEQAIVLKSHILGINNIAGVVRPMSARFLRNYFQSSVKEISLTQEEITRIMEAVHKRDGGYSIATPHNPALMSALNKAKANGRNGTYTSEFQPVAFISNFPAESDYYSAFGSALVQAQITVENGKAVNVKYKINDDYTWKGGAETLFQIDRSTYTLLSNYFKSNRISRAHGIEVTEESRGYYFLRIQDEFFTNTFERHGLAKTFNIISPKWSNAININIPVR
ncbi:MAG: hypothetical protein SFU25_02340 [Candidatus Caenarcaniphilales bacterium]|nr:hypothetical protein [Candidatus Caenarcaniphilales bacterium]